MEHKSVKLEVKDLDEDAGTFTAWLSIYGKEDLEGDVVERGAFTRSIKARPEIPIKVEHKESVGTGRLEDTAQGLLVKGKLSLGIQAARDALVLLKDGVFRGMSIGFLTVPGMVQHTDRGRRLKELKLFEGSMTSIPTLEEATILSVKNNDEMRAEIRSIVKDEVQALRSEIDTSEQDPVAGDEPAAPSADPDSLHSALEHVKVPSW